MKTKYNIIIIGAGSGGLSAGLFMAEAGFKVLMVSKSDHDVGGDCLNDGCVPSKAFIHVAKIVHQAKLAENFGLQLRGEFDIKKAVEYVYGKQEIIREHENPSWLKKKGVDVALGEAKFTGKNEIEVLGVRYSGKKIIIATGSSPRKLILPGVDKVQYFDNENIFNISKLPNRLLVLGGGPIGIEIAQVMSRYGSNVTVVQHSDAILEHDDLAVSRVLLQQLEAEGIKFLFRAQIESFLNANVASIRINEGETTELQFDAVFVAIGRDLNIDSLNLERAGIEVKDGKIIVDKYLRTTNKQVFACGDIAGSLQFSHVAEFHARMLLNNFFSPLKKKLSNDQLSWVTFTDPELATFGLNEKQLRERKISYERLELDFMDDDRATVENHRYGKSVLFITGERLFRKAKILGGTMVAPNAGELIQELILASTSRLSVEAIFDKIYPYPVASRVNQKIIIDYKQRSFSAGVKHLLRIAFKIFS